MDPDDCTHQMAYLALHVGMVGVKADKVTQYLARAKEQLSHGASTTLDMFAVPKQNFPNGLPDDLKDFVKTVADLTNFALCVAGDLDPAVVYVIDLVVIPGWG